MVRNVGTRNEENEVIEDDKVRPIGARDPGRRNHYAKLRYEIIAVERIRFFRSVF